MKVCIVLSIIISTFIKGSEHSGIRISSNVTSVNGLICPEVTELTCTTRNVEIDSLRWNHDGSLIDSLTYVPDTTVDEFPLPRDVPSDIAAGFLSYVIERADVDDQVINFTAVLVVDIEELSGSNFGYNSLECGNVFETGSFNFSQLDQQVPSAPQILNVRQIFFDDSVSLEIQVNRTVYTRFIPCQYIEDTSLNVSITNSTLSSVTIINNSTCDSTCVIPFQDIPGDQDIQVSLFVRNKFGDSEPITYTVELFISLSEVQSTFNFSVSYIDCETRAMCAVFRALNVSNCSVRYGEDSSYQDFSGTISPQVNESFSLMELEEETTYYFEVTFTVSNEIDHIYRLQRSYQSGTCGRPLSSEIIIVIGVVVPVTVLVLILTCLVLGVVMMRCCWKSHKFGNSSDVECTDGKFNMTNRQVGTDNNGSDDEYKDATDDIVPDSDHRVPGEDRDAARERLARQEVVEGQTSVGCYEDIPG